jgi:hypothetical protein
MSNQQVITTHANVTGDNQNSRPNESLAPTLRRPARGGANLGTVYNGAGVREKERMLVKVIDEHDVAVEIANL